ncbi:hypothetical protein GWI33_001965 [Rhynchophorus ferrugineus]|uniref:Disks large-associated protein 5 n=1 Tax=Rhynchophorus ferrugineus TaxID=354439 RepID=A0A834IKW6_RHYFE|nr:hypothetical protein GWI33_001965 [Rhynchophorus ferrugineus]
MNKASTMGQTSNVLRKENFNLARKNKRDTLMNYRRNIDANTSPYITPVSNKNGGNKNEDVNKTKNATKINANCTKNDVPNKRLELLAKWKSDKAERKKVEKMKSKPIFKYCHVSPKTVSDIATANKVIKGKPIAPSSATKKSQFAPPNHKFRAPNGIKPLEFKFSSLPVKDTNETITNTNRIKDINKKHKKAPQQNNIKNVTLVEKIPKVDIQKKDKIRKSNSGNSNGKINNGVQTRSNKNQLIGLNNVPEIKNKTAKANNNDSEKLSTNKRISNCQTHILNGLNMKKDEILVASVQPNITKKMSTVHDQKNTLKKTPKKNRTKKKEVNETNEQCTENSLTPEETELITDIKNISLQSPLKQFYPNSKNLITPETLNKSSSVPVYVSPFVTISRGKKSARQEYKVRNSIGSVQNSAAIPDDLTSYTSPKSGAGYFTNKLNMEIERLTSLCDQWEAYLNGSEVPDEARSSIDVAIGQSKLLMSKKFQQFRGLIDQCRSPNATEKSITCSDLHGFWDMIYMQVEDLDKRFNNLDKLKENNWEEMMPQKKVPERRARGRPKKATATSKLRDLIMEARKKKQEEAKSNEEKLFHGGCEVRTPVKDEVSRASSLSRRSVRNSLLLTENRTPCGSSPGLTMMKISQSIKQGQGLTPFKGILKADSTKSTGKKSVVFKEDFNTQPKCKVSLFTSEDKENVTPRRSLRFTNK